MHVLYINTVFQAVIVYIAIGVNVFEFSLGEKHITKYTNINLYI